MGDYVLGLEAPPSPALGLSGSGARSLALTSAGARSFSLAGSPVDLELEGAAFDLELDSAVTPDGPSVGSLIEDPVGSGFWRQEGNVFTSAGGDFWTPTDQDDFVGGPPFWEYVGS